MKKYSKPEMLAKNAPTGSYAAGCPENKDGGGMYDWQCKKCERTM